MAVGTSVFGTADGKDVAGGLQAVRKRPKSVVKQSNRIEIFMFYPPIYISKSIWLRLAK
jgi:hypothetical protein